MVETKIGGEVKKATDHIKSTLEAITKDCISKLEHQYGQVLEQITPYDTEDARQVLQKQHDLLDVLEHSNAALVSENSKRRVHHSFMPIRYREEVEAMQKNQLFAVPNSEEDISSQDSYNHDGALKFVEAPRAHEMVRRYLHDCEYVGINEITQGIREAAKLKVNLYKNVVPYKHSYVGTPPPLLPDNNQISRFPTRQSPTRRSPMGKGKAPLRPSYFNAAQGTTTRRKETDHRDISRPARQERRKGGHGARVPRHLPPFHFPRRLTRQT